MIEYSSDGFRVNIKGDLQASRQCNVNVVYVQRIKSGVARIKSGVERKKSASNDLEFQPQSRVEWTPPPPPSCTRSNPESGYIAS